jgi:hypothetical protein
MSRISKVLARLFARRRRQRRIDGIVKRWR